MLKIKICTIFALAAFLSACGKDYSELATSSGTYSDVMEFTQIADNDRYGQNCYQTHVSVGRGVATDEIICNIKVQLNNGTEDIIKLVTYKRGDEPKPISFKHLSDVSSYIGKSYLARAIGKKYCSIAEDDKLVLLCDYKSVRTKYSDFIKHMPDINFVNTKYGCEISDIPPSNFGIPVVYRCGGFNYSSEYLAKESFSHNASNLMIPKENIEAVWYILSENPIKEDEFNRLFLTKIENHEIKNSLKKIDDVKKELEKIKQETSELSKS